MSITNIVLDLDNTLISSVGTDEDGKKFLPKESKFELERELRDEMDENTRMIIKEKIDLLEKILQFEFNIMKESIDEDLTDTSSILYIVFQRPHLQEFLDFLFSNFKVSVWSAASKDYVLFIINNIILKNKPTRQLEWIFFDEHCSISKKIGLQREIKKRIHPNIDQNVLMEGRKEKKSREVMSREEMEDIKELHIKDLRLFWDIFKVDGFTCENTIIIDDLPEVNNLQPQNSIKVKPFNFTDEDSEKDTYLLYLIDFLKTKIPK